MSISFVKYSIQVIVIATIRKNTVPINDKIKANEVLLVDANGEKRGLVSLPEALEAAKESSLDLVQVSPSDANPIVCKILDYGKHLFSKKKNIYEIIQLV